MAANRYAVAKANGTVCPTIMKTDASAQETADSATENDLFFMARAVGAYLQPQQALRQQLNAMLQAQQVAHCSQKPPPICCWS